MTLLVIFGLWVLWQLRDIAILLFVSLILMSTLRPLVDWAQRKGIPRWLSSLLSVITLIAVIIGILVYVMPPLIAEMKDLSIFLYRESSLFLKRELNLPVNPSQQVGSLLQFFPTLTSSITTFFFVLLSNLMNVMVVVFFAVYMLLEIPNMGKRIHRYLPEKKATLIMSIMGNIEVKLGSWMRGQGVLMIVVGCITYIGLTLLGVPYALPLAVIAGLLELIPNIGPVLSAVPAVIIALSSSWWLGVAVAGLYVVIQQLENYILVPTVMRQTVGIHPFFSLLALMVGGRIAGVAGMLLIIPFVASVKIIVEEYLQYKRHLPIPPEPFSE